ncbi:Coenzyme PQQ synthesis protein E [Candidatus Tiddalikarchaeum anstoanum]|nr:Coenzyme PQQ synthesis protein E [Candidatus Tiddalikarchaeum anstoanum]
MESFTEMGKKLSVIKGILTNKIKVCEFALTNICSAQCSFCTIWKQQPKVVVDTEKAIKAVRHLSRLGVRFITLTGGEPLLHPNFEKIAAECSKENIITSILNADARLFTEQRLDALKRAKVDYVAISVDHYTNKVEFESRKIPGLLDHIKKAVSELKKRKIKTVASILISNFNHNCLGKLFKKCEELGFDTIAVNYPEFSESPVYTLGGEAIKLTNVQVIKALEEVIKLKKEFKIVNPVDSLNNIISYLKKETPPYPCLGGYLTLFVAWNFKVYPCMHLAKSFGDVLDLKPSDFKKMPCNKCNMSWYRDFSIFFHGAKSLKPLIKEVGNLGKY